MAGGAKRSTERRAGIGGLEMGAKGKRPHHYYGHIEHSLDGRWEPAKQDFTPTSSRREYGEWSYSE